MTFIISAYGSADAPGLAGAIDAVCAEGMMATSYFQPTSMWQHALEDSQCPRHLLLIAQAGERVIGWCRFFPLSCENGKDKVELGIGVVQDWRRQRVGTGLLRRGLRWAKERGYSSITLRTRPDNEPAIGFFLYNGFQFAGKSDEWLRMTIFPQVRMEQGVEL